MSWLLFDLHGSVAAVCPAASTTLSDAYRYDGFGQQIQSTGTVTNPWRYRGLLNLTNDFGVGALLDMGARDYAPQLGVFTQEDSVAGGAANPMTMNRFLYALADPATLIDPDGHFAASTADEAYTWSNKTPYHCVSSTCNPGVLRTQDTKLTPSLRDDYRTDKSTFSVSAEQARAGILQARLERCGKNQRCQRQAVEDARDPFQVGVTDTLAVASVSMVGGAACIFLFAACGPVLLVLGISSAVDTVSTAYTYHGLDVAGGHVGGTEPWTDYDRGAYLTSSLLFVAGGVGAYKYGGFGRAPNVTEAPSPAGLQPGALAEIFGVERPTGNLAYELGPGDWNKVKGPAYGTPSGEAEDHFWFNWSRLEPSTLYWKSKFTANVFGLDKPSFLQAAKQVVKLGLDWNKP